MCGLWGSRAGKSRWDGNWSRRRSTAMTSLLFHNNHSVLRLDDDGNVSQRVLYISLNSKLFVVKVFLMYMQCHWYFVTVGTVFLTIQSQHTVLRLLLLYNYFYCTISTSTFTATIEIVSLAENWTILLNNGTCWPWDGYAEDRHWRQDTSRAKWKDGQTLLVAQLYEHMFQCSGNSEM